jgi:glucose-1-phosphate adenylyltransferase
MNGKTPELARTQALILAGGQGERLHQLTVSRPKPAVSFGGMFRIIDFTLSNCLHSGLGRVSLATQYRHEELHRYIRDGWSDLWNNTGQPDRRPLTFLPPTSGKRYRGTADAVFQNSELLESDDAEFVLILSGDHIYHMHYRGFLRQHIETDADLTIATVEHPVRDASHFGVVEVDRNFKVTGFEEKPASPRPLPSRPSMALVSTGIYVFKKKVLLQSLRHFCQTRKGYDFGHDIIPSLIQTGRTYAYDFRDEVGDSPRYWRDIGTLDGYYASSMDLVQPDAPFDPYANDGWPSQPTRHPTFNRRAEGKLSRSTDIHCDVTRSVLSPCVQLEQDVTVADSVLMPGVRIGKGARLRRTIVEEGVHIPAGFQVGFDLDLDRNHHTVTEAGVVVVSRTPTISKHAVSRFALRGANTRAAKTIEHNDGVRVTA